MSDAPIVSIAEIKRRAAEAFAAKLTINDCPFNWHALAYDTWRAEFVRLQNKAHASPQSHHAPVSVLRVDEQQVAA